MRLPCYYCNGTQVPDPKWHDYPVSECSHCFNDGYKEGTMSYNEYWKCVERHEGPINAKDAT